MSAPAHPHSYLTAQTLRLCLSSFKLQLGEAAGWLGFLLLEVAPHIYPRAEWHVRQRCLDRHSAGEL